MIQATASATEMQNNFGRYLAMVMNGDEVIVTKNGREVGRFVPRGMVLSSITDSLTGILRGHDDVDAAREEGLRKKYEIAD